MSEKLIGTIKTAPKLQGSIKKDASLRGKMNYGSYELNKDYERLANKPKIEGITLEKNKTFEELGLKEITNIQLKEMFDKIFK